LEIPKRSGIIFLWKGNPVSALKGEVISSALIADGIECFGHHSKDGAPQGIFCANGQCSHCLVIADGVPVKACMTLPREGMDVWPVEGLPRLLEDDNPTQPVEVADISTDVLIAGAGPAGLNAALELAKSGVEVILCDDKPEIGGKLTLQTHNFFGSVLECHAGTRGIDIAKKLALQLEQFKNVQIWLNSPVIGAFADGKIGVIHNGRYQLIKPKQFLSATGAREKALAFQGHDLPGVFGAGAFQTLVNRDLVKPSSRVFIVGGGNVGLIAAYHALQAGIQVVGLVEALPNVGGYKVHLDKIRRLGVPVFTSHTIVKAYGEGHVQEIIIAQVDSKFKPIRGTERNFRVDTVLIAVGLNPVNELAQEAKRMGIQTYEAGDAELIAEASAAMFSGMVTARKMLQGIGKETTIPQHWLEMLQVLRGKAGPIHEFKEPDHEGAKVFPVVRCVQEIPCNPCVESCPKGWVRLESESIMSLPHWEKECVGCLRCAAVCPGLAITVVDRRFDSTGKTAQVWIPWELDVGAVRVGREVSLTGFEGEEVGVGIVRHVRSLKWMDRRKMIQVEVESALSTKVAGIRIQEPEYGTPTLQDYDESQADAMVCLCERVKRKEITRLVQLGYRDLNAIKAATRCGMGACNGKTCENLVRQVLVEEGIPPASVVGYVKRPFMIELSLASLLKEEH
jgi:NADPH-dependent 2,4-dienoyl-CoA reductase/sulfur reductase-like enzyme/Fe-S-cluster-containing hydrogenase component 2/bacterioferritin-associated ferredoxin